MIIKSKSRHKRTWRQLLNYMENGTDERSVVLMHNVRGKTMDEQVAEFEEAEETRVTRRKDSVTLYHEILSWHDEDTEALTQDKIDDMTLEYINLRAEKGLVVAMSHHTEDHVHVHLCISGVEYGTGKSMRISQSHFTAIKRTLQNYQEKRYPELTKSIADHGRKARQVRSEPEYLMKQRTGSPSKRDQLRVQLRDLFARSSSMEQFKSALGKQGMELYFRNGRPQGVRVDDVKYRLTSLGITKEDIARWEQVPTRLQEIQRIRDRSRSKDRGGDEPTRERPTR